MCYIFSKILRPPRSALFPYTSLFRSIDAARIQQERDLRAAGVDGVESRGGFALIAEMGFCGYRLRSDAKSGLEDSFVKRSEEHTSELQSRFELVCRPLLEKINTNMQA